MGDVGTVVRYNISQNDHHHGINISGPVMNATVYNNTIYVGEGERVDLLLYSDWGGWSDGMSFYNNIFHVEGAAQFFYGVGRSADGAYKTALGLGPGKNNAFDSNVYYQISRKLILTHSLPTRC